MRRSWSTVVLALVVTSSIAGAGTAAALTGHHHPSAHRHHARHLTPTHNVQAKPSYTGACSQSSSSTQCITLELAAINHARSLEHVKPMVLPSHFTSLSPARQTFVVTNLERTARGLRPFVALVRPLNSLASHGARHETDPALNSWRVGSAQAWKYASNQARDYNALAADYDYMYNDGYSVKYNTTNADCTSEYAKGCWGHRKNILTHYGHLPLLIEGVAEVNTGSWQSSAIIMVGARGHAPATSFTWHAGRQ